MDSFAAKQNPPIKMNYAAAQEHVPRAERNNRVVQERVRANYYQLPYDTLTKILVKYLVSESTRKLNFVLAKHGLLKHYSPRIILHQKNIDFDCHCTNVLGECVQTHEDEQIKNNNKPRALDCLYLRPTANHQGGHELLHLQTNRVITRQRITRVPITPSVIKQVRAIAHMEDMPKGIKIKNRNNNILFDSSLTAGVDYDEAQFDEEINDKDYLLDESTEIENEDQLTDDMDEMDDNELGDILEQQYVLNNQEETEEGNIEEGEIEEDQIEEDEIEEDNIDEEYDDDEDEEEYIDENTENEPRIDGIQETTGVRRTAREIKVPERLGDYRVHLHSEKKQPTPNETVLATIMCHLIGRTKMISKNKFYQMIHTYSLNKGMKAFGTRAKQAAHKEMS